MEELSNIFMTSGVNEKGEGFVTIAAHGSKGTILTGQITSEEVRQHAMSYLEAAEAADQDAAVYRVLFRLDLPQELAGLVITELRKAREE